MSFLGTNDDGRGHARKLQEEERDDGNALDRRSLSGAAAPLYEAIQVGYGGPEVFVANAQSSDSDGGEQRHRVDGCLSDHPNDDVELTLGECPRSTVDDLERLFLQMPADIRETAESINLVVLSEEGRKKLAQFLESPERDTLRAALKNGLLGKDTSEVVFDRALDALEPLSAAAEKARGLTERAVDPASSWKGARAADGTKPAATSWVDHGGAHVVRGGRMNAGAGFRSGDRPATTKGVGQARSLAAQVTNPAKEAGVDAMAKIGHIAHDVVHKLGDVEHHTLEANLGGLGHGMKARAEQARTAINGVTHTFTRKMQHEVGHHLQVSTGATFVAAAKEIIQRNGQELRGRVTGTVKDEFEKVAFDVQEVMKDDDEQDHSDISGVLAALIAPSRLRVLTWYNKAIGLHSLIIFIWCVCSLNEDWNGSCDAKVAAITLRTFVIMYAGAQVVELICRFLIYREMDGFWAAHSLSNIVKKGGGSSTKKVGDGIDKNIEMFTKSVRLTNQYGNSQGRATSAMQELMADAAELGDEAVCRKRDMDKKWYMMTLVLMHPLFTAYRTLGTKMWFDLPCVECEQPNLEWLLTILVFEFVVTATYHLGRFAFFFYFIKLKYYEPGGLERRAKDFDATTTGLPLMQTLVESFFVDDGSHIRKILIRRNRYEIEQLRREIRSSKKELAFVNQHMSFVEEQIRQLNVHGAEDVEAEGPKTVLQNIYAVCRRGRNSLSTIPRRILVMSYNGLSRLIKLLTR